MARRVYSEADKERFAAERREKLDAMHDQLTSAIMSLQNGQEWTSWLKFASGFHRYSFNNTVLMWSQAQLAAKPMPTMVAGYRAWKAKGCSPRAGEGMRIFAPVSVKVPLRDEGGQPIQDPAGDPVLVRRMVGVKPVTVWDIAGVDGSTPPPPMPRLLEGQAPPGLWDALAQLVDEAGYRLSRGPCDGANGWTNYATKEIRVREDVDDAQAVKTLVHELAHARLHAPGTNPDAAQLVGMHRGVKEVEAESVAFMVLDAHGVDTSQYTFNYVLGWAQEAAQTQVGVVELVSLTGQRVVDTADAILQHARPDDPTPFDPGDALAASMDIVVPRVGAGVAPAGFETVPQPAATHLPVSEPATPALAVAR